MESGTIRRPKVHDIHIHGSDRILLRREIYTYTEGDTKVVGTNMSVKFSLNRSRKETWPIFQNFNAWQNETGYYYTRAFGETREGDIEFLRMTPNRHDATIDATQAFVIQVLVPEHLIVLFAPAFGHSAGGDAKAGGPIAMSSSAGGFRHVGKHCFMLTEVDGKTLVTAQMQHSYHYPPEFHAQADAYLEERVKGALALKQNNTKDKWETGFEPKLRSLVER